MVEEKNKLKRTILIHVKSLESLKNTIAIINKVEGYQDLKVSEEVLQMIEEFENANWKVFLTTLEEFDFNSKEWKAVYDIENNTLRSFGIDEMNEKISIMVIRNLGSVEAKYKLLQDYLSFLIDEYKGIVLNNAKAMKKGMNKQYLLDIDKDYLSSIGIKVIPSEAFSNKVKMEEIDKKYNEKKGYLIKPITGELSNSIKELNEIDEEFLRYKENKVGGWIIQPIQKYIWNGEYQQVFINKELVYSQEKKYQNENGEKLPIQKSRIILKYTPSESETARAKKLIDYMSNLYDLQIDICRVDYMKDEEGNMILLEFEMVNPGFFIGYMEKGDKDIKNIMEKFLKYCEILIK